MSLKTYSVKIGGAERELKYGVNALAAITQELHRTPVEILFAGFDVLDIMTVRIVLWAGLLHSARKITPETIGDWMDKGETPYAELVEVVMSAFVDSCQSVYGISVAEEEEEGEPEKN